jgi:transcriptional regulator with AAA-type ATPase domain
MAPTLRARLAEWIERGTFARFARPRERLPRARLVVIHPPGAQSLARALSAQRLSVPPLRDRLEDIPLVARAIAAGGRPRLRAAGTRGAAAADGALLPGNLRELREALLRAATEARDGRVTAPERRGSGAGSRATAGARRDG